MLNRTQLTTLALAVAGGGLFAWSSGMLKSDGKFDFQPNPLGVNRSAYGQVIAMAIQTPIDADWHGAIEVHEHAPTKGPLAVKKGQKPPFITRLNLAASRRTNPNPPTAGHKFYIRRGIERKMRFAYGLDPSHYGNYNAYNLFITQTAMGTQGYDQLQMTVAVRELANHTIAYSLQENTDPRPSLTAASAAYNIIERMLMAERGAEEGKFTTQQMRNQLQVMDMCIHKHYNLLDFFIEDGHFENLSPARQQEIIHRGRFAQKLRDSALQAIQRCEMENNFTSFSLSS